MAGMAELVLAPVRLHDAVRPYVLAGAGARRYHYSWPGSEVLVTGGDHGETALAVHAGLGFEIDVLGATLVTELVNYRSERGDPLIAPDSEARPDSPRRRAQSDLAFNVGWRVLRF